MDLPLAGVLVVALEQAVAAPFATRQLADLGARVIKVERPEGDFARGFDRTVHGLSSHFVWLNRGKESIVVDLKQDRDVLDALLDRADVFVQNLSPSAAARLGVSARQVTEGRPPLIACDISGYGSSGPYAERKAYDLLIQNEAGLVSITGTDQAPAKAGISIADIAAGMYAYSGILTALYQRRATGRGQALEVSMLEALGEWMGYPYLYARYGGAEPPRAGASHATIAPYGPVRTGSGETVVIGLQNDREWQVFCVRVLREPRLLEDPRFADNIARVANRKALDELVGAAFAARSYAEITRDLDEAGIAYASQRTMAGFAGHPQLAARQRWRTVRTPGGDVEALLPPVTSDSWHPRMGPVPALGEHTDAIRDWLGY
ncbi:MAG TPA: CaiB/BaiF CoA-transferase family protein [Streptosporangiaceae bacterium]|nr:CaiB/BaiF CoA-transferase family protein [Streptosporangiaceae bacterium]